MQLEDLKIIQTTATKAVTDKLVVAKADSKTPKAITVEDFSKSTITPALVNGAVAIANGTVVFTKEGVAAMTLAAPTAAQAGTTMVFTSGTANAHTLTATGLIEDGVTGGAKTTATFAAFVGSSLTLQAVNLKWHVISLNACVIS
jgi:hypothetical protein